VFVTIPIYESRDGAVVEWIALGVGPHAASCSGAHPSKLEERLREQLRATIARLRPAELAAFQMARGTRLERVHVELTLRGAGDRRKVSGLVPLIVAPRWTSRAHRIEIAYHPRRQLEWFPVHDDVPIAELAAAYFQRAWADVDDEALSGYFTRGRDVVKVIAFTAQPRSLGDDGGDGGRRDGAASPGRDGRGPREEKRGLATLREIGQDLTPRAAESQRAHAGRAPYREQLRLLAGGREKQSAIVVGAPGVGKSTLLEQWIRDLLDAEDYPSHKNLDRVTHVFRVSGKRLLAGMSRLGDWEQRALDLLDEVLNAEAPIALWLDDVHIFGRIGRSRDSERNLAEFFRGPIARRDVVVVGECTKEQLARLEEDAPAFAALLARVHVAPATPAETFRMMVQEVRELEPKHHVEVSPSAIRTVLDLGAGLASGNALPGKALDLLRRAAQRNAGREGEPRPVDGAEIVAILSETTGLPRVVLEASETLDPARVEADFAREVMGQPEAVRAARDLVVRIKAGLVEPARPYGVFLFVGPTGTGKTELAKAIAEYLYGAAARLVRFDMGEFAGPDAVARLIGDRWEPEGLLTRAAREQPFSVILLDEIDKAHPLVLNLLLQLFDEARLTDAAGDTASFEHAVLVMTSNHGARSRPPAGFDAERERELLHQHVKAVKEIFAPELFNRIDRVVPFAPLSEGAARAVAAKELRKLFARRGLTDRNVFVTADPSVVDLVVREAFHAPDGARSLKRWLEDHVGTLLTAHLVAERRAEMRLVRLFSRGHGIELSAQALHEASPIRATFPLEALASAPLAALEPHLRAVKAQLDDLERSGALARLEDEVRLHLGRHRRGDAASADALFDLDSLRAEIGAFRERVEHLAAASAEAASDELELSMIDAPKITEARPPRRYRLFQRRSIDLRASPITRALALETIAEGYFLRRAMAHAGDRDAHACFVEVLRLGDRGGAERFGDAGPGLFEWLVAAYEGARGEVEECAVLDRDGVVATAAGPKPSARADAHRGEPGRSPLDPAAARLVVLKIVGVAVRDFFELETGTHIRHALGASPEIVRVRVLPAHPDDGAARVVERHAAAVHAFAEAVAAGGDLPEDPDALLPATRTVRFDPPRKGAQSTPVEIEDYAMGTTLARPVRRLADALYDLFQIRMSREDA